MKRRIVRRSPSVLAASGGLTASVASLFETPIDPELFARAREAWRHERWSVALDSARRAYEQGRARARRAGGKQLAARAGACVDPDGPPCRPVLHDATVLYADVLYLVRRIDEAMALLDESVAAGYLSAEEPPVLLLRGWVRLRRGEIDAVAAAMRDLLARAAELHPIWHGQALHLAGITASERGRASEAREHLRDAVAIYRAAGDRRGLADALNALGTVEMGAFRLEEGRQAVEEALRLNRELDRRERVGVNLSNLAICYYKLGMLDRSDTALTEAESTQSSRAAFYDRLLRRLARGKLHVLQGRAEEAAPIGEEAERAARQRGFEREEILAIEIRGDAELGLGRWREALALFRRGLRRAEARALGSGLVPGLLRRCGEASLAGERFEAAEADLVRAAETARRCRERYEEAESRRLLAELWRRRSAYVRAYREARRAMILARDHGAGLVHGEALLEAARIQGTWWTAIGDSPRGSDDSYFELWASSAGAPAGAEASGLMAGPAVPAHPGDPDGPNRERAQLIRGHLEAAWTYAVEALHQFQELDHASGREAALTLMSRLRAHWQPPWADSPAARVLEDRPDLAFVAEAPATARMRRLLDLAADGDDPVLVTGETGTGKELAARYLHARSPRRDRPLVAVNCAAIPPTLFEREFFGHAAGAFSGADEDRAGLCEQADGGTLFLDEVGEIPPALQAKLLRLLQEGVYHRLGDPVERRVDVRIVAATNADLVDRITRGAFRADLYFRLQILAVRMPPLRERLEDLLPLADHFVRRSLERDVPFASLCADGVVASLLAYDWPGNVRELEGLVRRLCVLIRGGGRILSAMLPAALRNRAATAGCGGPAGGAANGSRGTLRLAVRLAAAERQALHEALAAARGNRSQAARLLGIGRGALYRKLRAHAGGEEAAERDE
jgi:DNA-binding NtrC family response regulator/tetratricopeptide (TPR) repeat protein